MAVNQYGQNYVGNDDYRGWLAAGGAGNIDPYSLGITGNGPLNSQGTYGLLLKHVGNNGRSGNSMIDAASQKLYAQYLSGRQTSPAPQNPNGGGGGGSAAPKVDRSNDIALQLAGLAAVDQQTNSGLSAVDKALAGLFSQYDTETQANEANYGEQSNTNQGNLQKGKQSAYVNAAMGRKSLFGTLSGIGALNGDGIKLANRAVQKGANDDLSGAAETYSNNQTSLDGSIGAYRLADQTRRKQNETAAEDAKTNVKNQAAKSRQTFYGNLANNYVQMGDTGNAKRYTDMASALYPEIAATSVPSTALNYTAAAFQPSTLSNYLAGSNSTQVSTTGGSGGGLPGLMATSTRKKQLV